MPEHLGKISPNKQIYLPEQAMEDLGFKRGDQVLIEWEKKDPVIKVSLVEVRYNRRKIE